LDLVPAPFEQQGFRVARSLRFTGGWIVRRFADVSAVDAVQVELNQDTYRIGGIPHPVTDRKRFENTQRRLIDVFAQLAVTYGDQS
jgi:N-formylglutamate amidohydrolase